MYPGISFLQGGHHVAQKSKMMTLPLNELRSTSLPLISLSVKFRFATLPLLSQTSSAALDGDRLEMTMNTSAVPIMMPIVLRIIFVYSPNVGSSVFSFFPDRIARKHFQYGHAEI